MAAKFEPRTLREEIRHYRMGVHERCIESARKHKDIAARRAWRIGDMSEWARLHYLAEAMTAVLTRNFIQEGRLRHKRTKPLCACHSGPRSYRRKVPNYR